MWNRAGTAWIFAVAICCAPAANAQTLPPLEAFGNLPLTSGLSLSPDGKHFALVRPVNGRPAAVIYETIATPGVKPAVVTSSDGIIANVLWAKNDRLIVIVKRSATRKWDSLGLLRTWARAFSVDVNGGNMALLLKNMPTIANNTNAANVIDVNLDDPDYVLMGLHDAIVHIQEDFGSKLTKADDDFKYDVIKVNARTGTGQLLKSGNSDTIAWLSDSHGNPVVQIDESKRPLKDRVRVFHDGGWKDFGTFDASEGKWSGVTGLTENGKALVFARTNEQSFVVLTQREIATGADTPLFAAPERDVTGVMMDEWTKRVIGASYIADKEERRYFDPQRQALQSGLELAFPGLAVHIVSWDVSKNSVILSVEGPRLPPTYYYLDRTTHQTQLLASTYPDLKESDLGEMKPYDYKARDGLTIPAYLTLPPGKAPKNLPVVVMPHGGPDARDYVQFDWMAQFLANRGYVVLQPNFRGSEGYGHKFTEAGLQQWGRKMQDDVTDGVNKLLADGIADPKRICIFGSSFGGYVALVGAAFTPELYACAASWAGVSDLPVQLHAAVIESGAASSAISFWMSRMGGEDISELIATSPARNVDKVKCPVLLMHGEGDTTVRIEQSEIMNEALQKARKKVEFIRFPGEDHYMNVADTRIRLLKALEKFLRENIGN